MRAANITYGFRRNTFALRPLAWFVCVLSAAMATVAWVNPRGYFEEGRVPLYAIALVVDVLFLGAWIFGISSRWVRTAADDYATHLLNATTL